MKKKEAKGNLAVIYARYSSHNQRDVSIDQQVKVITEFADRSNLKVISVYADRAISGTTDNRPEFQRMIEDAKSGGFQYVIVYSIDRFARDRFDSITCKKTSNLEYWLPAHFDVMPYNGHWGSNYRMNEIQAAVGCCQLDKLPMLTAKRREIAHKITKGLKGVKGIETVYEPDYANHVFHLYTLCVDEKELGGTRDEFMRVLYEEEGIQGILHYQPTFHFTGLRMMGYDPNQCPIASKFFYQRELNLPMHPRLTDEAIATMVKGIKNAAAKIRKRHCKA